MRIYLSEVFGLPINGHKDIGFIDVASNDDTRLFLDPYLIETQTDPFSVCCRGVMRDYIAHLYQAAKQSPNSVHMIPFLQNLGERNEARLGYGTGRNGKAKTAAGMADTLTGLHSLIRTGVPMEEACDIPLLMPRFAEDCMSDMLLNVLFRQLCEFTVQQCRLLGIPTTPIPKRRFYWEAQSHGWKVYTGDALVIDSEIIILVPKHFVRPRFSFTTANFFMSEIATILQDEQSFFVNGKECKPTKKDVYTQEVLYHGTILDATRKYTQEMPYLLDRYHRNMFASYSDRVMSDDELDKLVYAERTTDTVA